MKRIGFFEGWLFDVNWRERAALNEAAHALEMQDIANENSSTRFGKLFALDRAQGDEIAKLRCLVEVLSEMLVDAKVLTEDALEFRVKDRVRAMTEAAKPKMVGPSSGPYRGGGEAPAPVVPERTVTCGACREEVLARTTQITATGVVCDSCYYARV